MPDASKLNFFTPDSMDKIPYSGIITHSSPAAPDLGGGFFGPIEEERIITNPYGRKGFMTLSFTIDGGVTYNPMRVITYNAGSSYGNPAGVVAACDDTNIVFWFTHYIGTGPVDWRVRWVLDTIT